MIISEEQQLANERHIEVFNQYLQSGQHLGGISGVQSPSSMSHTSVNEFIEVLDVVEADSHTTDIYTNSTVGEKTTAGFEIPVTGSTLAPQASTQIRTETDHEQGIGGSTRLCPPVCSGRGCVSGISGSGDPSFCTIISQGRTVVGSNGVGLPKYRRHANIGSLRRNNREEWKFNGGCKH
jgi:hypothetical protein